MQSDSIDGIEELGDNKHGYIIRAVLKILDDCRPRSRDEILEAGKAAGTLPKNLSRKSLYIHITGFIGRQLELPRFGGRLVIRDSSCRRHPPFEVNG